MSRTPLMSCCLAALLAFGGSLAAQTPTPVAPAQPAVPQQAPAPTVTEAPAVAPAPAPLPATLPQTAPTAPVAGAPQATLPAVPTPAADVPQAAIPAPVTGAAPAAPAATGAQSTAAPLDLPAAPAGEVAGAAPTEAAPAVEMPAGEAAAVAEEAAAPSQPLPSAHDLSPIGMYQQADLVVKSVMILLVAACFLTWTVWLFKSVETIVARRRARRAARVMTAALTLDEAARVLTKRRDPAAFMAHAVLEEYRRSDVAIDPAGPEGVKERAVSLVNRVEAQAAARMRRGMGLLATVGSVSPFVGLFGTVWGIMNAFIGIAESQTTNLAVVAPGIAEALFATALGLVAAIPAVVIYNIFTRAIAAYRQSLGDAGAGVLRLLSRDIDFRHVRGA